MPKPVLQYTFDGNKQLADQNGKNELKLSGGASVTDDGNKGKDVYKRQIKVYLLLAS